MAVVLEHVDDRIAGVLGNRELRRGIPLAEVLIKRLFDHILHADDRLVAPAGGESSFLGDLSAL